MRIVQVSSEFAPLAKAGGMGEVLVGLSREQIRQGHDVQVILPKYDTLDLKSLNHIKLEVPDFKCWENGQLYANAMWSGSFEGCPLHLLEARHPAGYFHRGKIYGCEDDTRRFLYFCRAVLEYLKIQKIPIDVLHLHDWHSASLAVMQKELFQLPIRSIVLTLHNVEYQGKCAVWDLDGIGLSGKRYLTEDQMQDDDPQNKKTINLLKGGLVYADGINAVSKSYAKEILTPQMGFHLEKTLKQMKHKLTGILNGIDEHLWNPHTDPYLSCHFHPGQPIYEVREAKQTLKQTLASRFRLDSKKPWIGAITRLAFQKGPELLEEAIHRCKNWGVTFLLLGSACGSEMHSRFAALKKKYKDHPQLFLHFEYDEPLAHQLYGALDYILIPSRFEPCGLTQLIGMRYGTIPIARSTGGLKDTIFDCEDASVPLEQRNGFLFSEASIESMDTAIRRAVHVFHKNQALFDHLLNAGLKTDSSWKKPAQEYLQFYQSLME